MKEKTFKILYPFIIILGIVLGNLINYYMFTYTIESIVFTSIIVIVLSLFFRNHIYSEYFDKENK